MKILYNNLDGKIFYAVPDRDWFWFRHTTNIPLSEMAIDEIDPTNKAICLDLVRTCNKVDEVGDGKYALIGGVLQEKINWIEKQYDI